MEQSLKKQSGEKQGSPIIRVASFIVDKRMLFFLLYILITVFSLFSSGWVGVENDLSEYLSESVTEPLSALQKQLLLRHRQRA